MKVPGFILFVFLYPLHAGGQNKIEFSDGFDFLHQRDVAYSDIKAKVGEASKINKDKITTPFCGVTTGQDIHFIYEKFNLNITTRKHLGYVDRSEIGSGKAYFNNAYVTEVIIAGNSSLKINNTPIKDLKAENIVQILGTPADTTNDYGDLLYIDPCCFPKGKWKDVSKTEEELTCYSYKPDKNSNRIRFYFYADGRLSFVLINPFEQ